jgi:2-oxo-3-(phosphooxy)propyl 3-oxoalkanoate synthase
VAHLSLESSARGHGLAAERTVPRALVHKHALDQVFIADAAETDGRHVALAQLPRANLLFSDTLPSYHDALLIGEAARQGVMVVLHRFLDVPLESQIVIGELAVSLSDLEANRAGPELSEMTIAVEFGRRRTRRDGMLRSLEGWASCSIDGTVNASFSGSIALLRRSVYRSLRGNRTATNLHAPVRERRAEPAAVGRRDPRNVVVGPLRALGGERYAAAVVADPGHPVFFDHPQDHYPGLLLLEVARQAAVGSAALQLGCAARAIVMRGCSGTFSRFVELDTALEAVAEVREPAAELRAGAEIEVRVTVGEGEAEAAAIDTTLVVGVDGQL